MKERELERKGRLEFLANHERGIVMERSELLDQQTGIWF